MAILAGVTVIFTLAWCIASLLRRASAALRHIVWTCAFAAALLLIPLRWRMPHRVVQSPLPVVSAVTAAPAVAAVSAPRRSAIDFSKVLASLWAFGTIALLLRLGRNAVQLRRMVQSARGPRPIRISSGVKSPLVAGFWRPAILLPGDAHTWTLERRRAVLAHEAAHIRRRDPVILLGSHLVTALYWFHPLCWFAAARLRAESERACDDAALRLGLQPSGYAGHLLDLACRFDTQLAIPMATTSHLESRVKSILDPLTNRSVASPRNWAAAAVLTILVLAPLATLTLRAQQSATIGGIVSDPTGAVIANARVTATNTDTGDQQIAIANAVGAFTFNNLPGGYYTIEVQVPGFAPFRLENMAVVNGARLQADAHMVVGGLAERVTVAARGTPKASESTKAAQPGPVRVGGNVQAARLIERVNPVYPDDLQAQGIEGTVVLAAVISKEGVPSSFKVLKNPGNDEFVKAATDALQQWRYQPTMLNGEPVAVLTTIQIDFKLSAQAPIIDDRVQPLKVPRIDDRLIQ